MYDSEEFPKSSIFQFLKRCFGLMPQCAVGENCAKFKMQNNATSFPSPMKLWTFFS